MWSEVLPHLPNQVLIFCVEFQELYHLTPVTKELLYFYNNFFLLTSFTPLFNLHPD